MLFDWLVDAVVVGAIVGVVVSFCLFVVGPHF